MNQPLDPKTLLAAREPAMSQADYFAMLLDAQRQGRGVLPFFLGLQPLEMIWLSQRYSSGAVEAVSTAECSQELAKQRGDLRQELLEMRRDEWQDLRALLKQHRADMHPLEPAMADMVAAGCLGGDHLWRDMGLPDRAQLGDLLALFFPTLAAKNNRDMKWKKFFYKQLCEQEGGYVCRAPSCEECAVFEDCFGEEL